jgi:cell wall-associated NlpC family hydrolase
MKWLIGIVSVLTITACTAPAAQAVQSTSTQFVFTDAVKNESNSLSVQNIIGSEKNTNNLHVNFVESIAATAAKLSMMEKLHTNTMNMHSMISDLKKYVGHTWYAFSGDSPRGWDCSGLVMWAYQNMGITLEHRASVQQKSGTLVTKPKVGDIVAFTYKSSKYGAYHVGIYLGEDMMIDAPRPGLPTMIESISKFAGKYSKVTYTRILETL